MKLLTRPIVTAGLCFLCIVTLLFSGCDDAHITKSPEINPSLDEFTLMGLWDITVDTADLQESTAEMGTFHMDIDANGNLKHLYFDFAGRNNNGIPCLYFASYGYKSRIHVLSYETDEIVTKRHPALVFEEIDEYGLGSIERGDDGLTMMISFMGGDVGYHREYTDIFHLENGVLNPLNELIFHSQTQWCTVSLFRQYQYETVTTKDGNTVTTAPKTPLPTRERTNQIWFLSEDINLAETVTYWNNE